MGWVVYEITDSGNPSLIRRKWSWKNAYALADKLQKEHPEKDINVDSDKEYDKRLDSCHEIDKKLNSSYTDDDIDEGWFT